MRKLTLAVAGLVALVVASIAVAHGVEGAKTAAAVSSTFSATAGSVKSSTCTTSDNKTIVVSSAKYTGSATGSADLTGAIAISARSVVNTTDKVGTVSGQLRSGNIRAAFSAVYDNGAISGLAVGHAKAASVLANLSATFDPATGFTNGKLGGGTAGGSAVEVGRSSCKASSATHERSSARGAISAISSSSVTVAGLTCAIPTDQSSDVTSKYHSGDAVEIQCSYANGATTLTRISAKHGH